MVTAAGWPSISAGRKRKARTASTAASSKPFPAGPTTRTSSTSPSAEMSTSSTTSPSRPSASASGGYSAGTDSITSGNRVTTWARAGVVAKQSARAKATSGPGRRLRRGRCMVGSPDIELESELVANLRPHRLAVRPQTGVETARLHPPHRHLVQAVTERLDDVNLAHLAGLVDEHP